MIDLYRGDCLVESDKIEDGSVDLILTDLPYGTIKGMGGDMEKYKHLSNSNWDNVIDTDKIMQIANRILRKNGKMILTANQPFTTELISKAIPNLPHSYNMYWDKMHFANCLVANKAPVSYIEDILVFSKKDDPNDGNLIRDYFRDQRKIVSHLNYPQIGRILNITRQEANNWLSVDKINWSFPTLEKYTLLQKIGICKKPYNELLDLNNKHKKKFTSTFNLWQGNKYKSNILKYKKDYDGHHPTQKPILLLEDLIKTFSNENDLVVDLTMGSGSCGVACQNTNRDFIGIEMNDKYFDIAKERMEQ
jgi:site-specific DNA-methyltransferase (adenine-specific)